jgi:ribosome-binding factor A
MKYFRAERVSDLIQEELNKIILKEVETPGALLTITEVDVSKDLEGAIVKFSVYPSEKAESILKILNRRAGHLQYLLMKKINIKPMPKISFKIDYGPEKAAGVEKALLNK